ncbi:SDR family oxidoreductase [Nocardia sp. CA2R105]|uniref:SDR family NAD(P)-dependent oxidoreductase n=1 Tax=Nocardia coffeae TaxID=2873381 RepID=UPI001CA65F3B|nr:SDR family NAD(P)-dependent oxidoreductase [Nocardia coffeae]MBY8863764.1 SDR family oxidoreductase [Nocardia coffeae]
MTAAQLTGRVALVTGGGSGIGRATALRLAADGSVVVVNDLDAGRAQETTELITRAGGKAEARAGDVTDSALVDTLVDGTWARHGRLDVFHSNAGTGLAHGELTSISDEGWRADVELNLNAMFYCVRAALRVMSAAGGGSIICTSSASALGAVPGTGPYAAAKAAILQLVRSAAVEYGGTGVRVNAVIPGAVKTPAFRRYIGSDERLSAYERQIPLGRACVPEDIAAAVAWLASDESACVTGTTLVVDGGLTAKRAEPLIG